MRTCIILQIIIFVCFTVIIINADKKIKDNNSNSKDIKNDNDKLLNKSKLNQENAQNNQDKEHKRFIGRIEHGKVKVLRKKDGEKLIDSEEDHKERVCRKTKNGNVKCNNNNNNDDDDNNGNNEQNEIDDKDIKPRRIKYSIKFQHEKQKKKDELNNDSSILRLHKNERRRFRRHGVDEDDSSEEEDQNPIKKRYLDDEED